MQFGVLCRNLGMELFRWSLFSSFSSSSFCFWLSSWLLSLIGLVVIFLVEIPMVEYGLAWVGCWAFV